MITLYGFGRVNEKVVGVTRDLRALWALEETGLLYRVAGLDHNAGETRTDSYRRISPFEQIPVMDDDGFIIAESGAMLLYMAEKAGTLIPRDIQGRTHVAQWCFAALNTIEPPLFLIAMIDLVGEADPTGKQRRPEVVKWAEYVLAGLERRLARHAYVAGEAFTVADILMVTVLREVRKSEVLDGFPKVKDYAERCQQRPAWLRALADYERRLGVPAGTAR
jgi:glutathione S-transferase